MRWCQKQKLNSEFTRVAEHLHDVVVSYIDHNRANTRHDVEADIPIAYQFHYDTTHPYKVHTIGAEWYSMKDAAREKTVNFWARPANRRVVVTIDVEPPDEESARIATYIISSGKIQNVTNGEYKEVNAKETEVLTQIGQSVSRVTGIPLKKLLPEAYLPQNLGRDTQVFGTWTRPIEAETAMRSGHK